MNSRLTPGLLAGLGGLLLALALLLAALPTPVLSETIRVATFAAPLNREGPGLLLRDILKGEDAELAAIIAVIRHVAPDILLLTDFDHDHGGAALAAFAGAVAGSGLDYPFRFAPTPNSGIATGLDMDGNRRTGEARDAQGYGPFAGSGGLALLSRWPVRADGLRDFTALLWRDLPGAVLPVHADGAPFPSAGVREIQRLSSTGHWAIPVQTPLGAVTVMAWSATPPVFDGPEDMNGLRNRDEARLWQRFLDGDLGPPPVGRFVLMGNANLDPFDGDGLSGAMAALLADPRLRDAAPTSTGGATAADPGHRGDPALDTASWPRGEQGNLRVSHVIPSAGWTIADAGVFWPGPADPAAVLLGPDGRAAGSHRLVWVDLR